ncbi:hypothetical protein BJ165DRAFT_1527142 [Panaeolus papilionaceus]|nr:hypothetical protein BJ165DRAFT_1527142 [Panaeolus papilionaceus]
MVNFALPFVSLLAVLPSALAQIKPQQCGGKGWTGSTTCAGWYDQCFYITEALSECRVKHYGQCGGQGWNGNTFCAPE